MQKENLKQYEAMSPFELKNLLIEMAKVAKESFEEHQSLGKECKFLNAGRGNPNFLNTTVREAFCYLNLFATKIADQRVDIVDLGLRPTKDGIAAKLSKYLDDNYKEKTAAKFLKEAVEYAEKEIHLDADDFVYELVDASLGDFYPSPPRIFENTEKVVTKYLSKVLSSSHTPVSGKFDLFATEGATAAMIYIFKSLKENKILKPKDHIAIITPIFSPYLEIPKLNDYNLTEIFVKGDEESGWQIPQSEIDKLKDKKIKALFLVNPTNPTSVSLSLETLKKIEALVKNERQDLIVLTDTVYATFVDDFYSLVEVIPQNTICVYSYSKFFGVTGWRLGVIMLHEDNVVDRLIAKLPKEDIAQLDERYKMDSMDPEKIKFIDRLEIDSRDVALAHTGGLSCPQQCIMSLFSLFYLLDEKLKYKKSIQEKLKKRAQYLYDNLGIKIEFSSLNANYYTLIDIAKYAKEKHGEDFANSLINESSMIEFLFKLAKEKRTVCLPGEGFAGPKWSLRVSLANLEDDDYKLIGANIKEVVEGYKK